MKTFEYTFDAGETKILPGGRFFMLLDTTAAVDVDVYREGRKLDESAEGVEGGYKFWFDVIGQKFDKLEITSATAQTVKCAISRGQGGYDRSIGTVTIAGDVSMAPTDASLVTSYDNYNLAANTWYQIVDPAANVNGVDIVSAALANAGGGALAKIVHSNAIPSVGPLINQDPVVFLQHQAGANENDIPLPLQLAAGQGVWWATTGGSTSAWASLKYKLL